MHEVIGTIKEGLLNRHLPLNSTNHVHKSKVYSDLRLLCLASPSETNLIGADHDPARRGNFRNSWRHASPKSAGSFSRGNFLQGSEGTSVSLR